MFKGVLIKDTYREIKKSFNRFLSIFAIIALGAGCFAGIKGTSPDMKKTADRYFQSSRLMDLHAISTLGFNGNDVKSIRDRADYDNVMFGYSADVLMKQNGSNVVLKMISMPSPKDGKGKTLNLPRLTSGRLPQKSGECVVETNNMEKAYKFKLGGTISIEDDAGGTPVTNYVKKKSYKIVGFVNNPLYISFERGSSTIGNGTVDCFMMVLPEDFNLSVYTDAYMTSPALEKLSSFDKAYTQKVNSLESSLSKLGLDRSADRYKEEKTEGQKKLDDAKQQLTDAQNSLNSAKEKLDSNQKSITDARQQIASGQNSINEGKAKINSSQKQLDQAKADLAGKQNDYNNGLAQYNQAQFQLEDAKNQAGVGGQTSGQIQGDIDSLNAEMSGLSTSDPTYQQDAQLVDAYQKILQGQKQLDQQGATLADSKKQLDSANATIRQSQQEIDAQSASLQKTQNQLDSQSAQLSQAESQLSSGQKEYNEQVAENQPKIDSEQQSISEGQKQLDTLEMPKWYVETRDDNPGYPDYGENADRIAAVASVFPVFFLLVAALVCLTTMSRMVEEQRGQIGTLKAFGYTRASITAKYLIYASLASLLGSAAGIAFSVWLYPTVIYNAYTTMYTLPSLVILMPWGDSAAAALVAVSCTVLVTLFVCNAELNRQSAMLMRPKAPKPGKRVFLEYISPIWSHMGFISKVTARNILRYKARFLMTVLGVAGCGALILAGLGLRNSIQEIIPYQFAKLDQYSMIMSLNAEVNSSGAQTLTSSLKSDSRVKDVLLGRQKSVDAIEGQQRVNAYLFVPENSSRIESYIRLQHRNGDKVQLGNDGVLLTEKAASLLGVKKGDRIKLRDGDKLATVTVSDVVENYVYHYVYMSPALYTATFGEKMQYNTVLGKLNSQAGSADRQFATDWLKHGNILNVTFTTDFIRNFQNSIKGLNIVVLVMIIAAGCLAFVVLYNLTNINITERLREIAVIKVLGFYNREVSNYVYRENFILTILGVLLGLFLGIFLWQFVIIKSEVDIVMFGRVILPLSFLFAAALTLLFAFFVNFVLYFRLKKISMAESLKTVD